MPLPTDDLIIWASSDVNLPNLAGPNKVKPIDDLILKGWDFKQKPAADEFNYVLNNLGMHISYLEESKTYTFSGDVTGTVTSTGSDDITFNVSVTDNSHNHISANISDATSSNAAFMIVKRDANGSISIGDLTVNKLSNTSTIIFPASANDPGFIKHIETPADTGKLQFSVNDNSSTDDLFEFGNTQGGSFTPTFTITSSGVATGSNGQLHSVSVLTGTISHGGTIPLPSGYTESQCKWMVSINQQVTAISTDGADDHEYLVCSTSGRVVSCYISTKDSPTTVRVAGVANYITIGVK